MASEEQIEAVAKAICEAEGLDWSAQASAFTSGSGGDNEQDHYRHIALAALTAAEQSRAQVEGQEIDNTGDYVPFGPTERVDMLRLYLDATRQILRGSESAGCSPFSREKLARQIDRQLQTDAGRAAVNHQAEPSGDLAAFEKWMDELDRYGSIDKALGLEIRRKVRTMKGGDGDGR